MKVMEQKRKLEAAHLAVYTENTSIHGLKYLGEHQRPIIEKIFWIIVFAISFMYLGFFVQDVLKKFSEKNIVLVQDDHPTQIHEIPFPAVTICPVIKIKTKYQSATEALEWMRGTGPESMVLDLSYLICNDVVLTSLSAHDQRNVTKYLNQSHIELLHEISPNIKDTFFHTQFSTILRKYEANDLFSTILTNEGVCFTFNSPSEIIGNDSLQTEYKYHTIQRQSQSWDYEHGYDGYPRYPRSVWSMGLKSGLLVQLEAKGSDLNTFCQPTDNGYKIILHTPGEYPTTLEKFINIPHNSDTRIKVIPKLISTSHEVSTLKPDERQCYFNGERKLKYFTYYSRVNCKLECLANFTIREYGCVHFSLPRSAIEPICGTNVSIGKIYDTEEIMNSYRHFKDTLADQYGRDVELDDEEPNEYEKISNFVCNCLPTCNSIEYEYSVETEFLKFDKLQQKYEPESDPNYKLAKASFEIFFSTTKVTGSIRKQFYTLSDLIASIGGLVGLFMGASMVSIFEIIYFLFVR